MSSRSVDCFKHGLRAKAPAPSLREVLAVRGLPLPVRVGPTPQAMRELREESTFTYVSSHAEAGPGGTATRPFRGRLVPRRRCVLAEGDPGNSPWVHQEAQAAARLDLFS
jgi:hypothetical protein